MGGRRSFLQRPYRRTHGVLCIFRGVITMSKIEIVRFKNGKYGVRRSTERLWKEDKVEFLSLTASYWWGLKYKSTYCEGTLEQVRVSYDSILDIGTPI